MTHELAFRRGCPRRGRRHRRRGRGRLGRRWPWGADVAPEMVEPRRDGARSWRVLPPLHAWFCSLQHRQNPQPVKEERIAPRNETVGRLNAFGIRRNDPVAIAPKRQPSLETAKHTFGQRTQLLELTPSTSGLFALGFARAQQVEAHPRNHVVSHPPRLSTLLLSERLSLSQAFSAVGHIPLPHSVMPKTKRPRRCDNDRPRDGIVTVRA
jgi:hypothetical protein